MLDADPSTSCALLFPILGVHDEANCLPCLQCTPGLAQDKDDYCNICWTEPLGAAPCLQLGCGHIFHMSCIQTLLANKWGGYRIHFNFLKCPLCKVTMEHSLLDAELAPLRALFMVVKVLFCFHCFFFFFFMFLLAWPRCICLTHATLQEKALLRLEHEGLANCPDITTEGMPFYQNPAGYAMDRFNYFLCSRCQVCLSRIFVRFCPHDVA